MTSRHLLCLVLAALLPACASTGSGGTVDAPGYTPQVRPPAPMTARDPVFDKSPGLDGVVGATQAQLVGQFGDPRLDVIEGDARKLQFTSEACVLDIFLYPTSRSPQPIATWVEARRASDGRSVDKGSCVRALRGG